MADSPGANEGLKEYIPTNVQQGTNKPPVNTSPTEYALERNYYEQLNDFIKSGSVNRLRENDINIRSGLGKYLGSLADKYTAEVLPASQKGRDQNAFPELFTEWLSAKDRGFLDLHHIIEKFESTLSPQEFKKLYDYYRNLNHDAMLTLNGIKDNLEEHETTFINNYALEWPAHVMTRISRQLQEQPVVESFDPNETGAYLSGLFEVLSHNDPHFKLNFDIDPEIHAITSDKYYFEGALFNLIRNAQVIMRQRMDSSADKKIQVSMKLENGQVTITVQDNGGGFNTSDPEKNQLIEIPRKNAQNEDILSSSGQPIMIQRAFVRGETSGTGGTGFGLDIVRQIAEDHLKGSVHADNASFPGTENQGAVITMKFPYS